VASRRCRIGSPAVACSPPGDFATGCSRGRLGIARESQTFPGVCACPRPAPHDQEVSASGGCCLAAKGHLWLSLRLPQACNGHDGVAGVKQPQLLTIRAAPQKAPSAIAGNAHPHSTTQRRWPGLFSPGHPVSQSFLSHPPCVAADWRSIPPAITRSRAPRDTPSWARSGSPWWRPALAPSGRRRPSW